MDPLLLSTHQRPDGSWVVTFRLEDGRRGQGILQLPALGDEDPSVLVAEIGQALRPASSLLDQAPPSPKLQP
jgi:hypothetical protein